MKNVSGQAYSFLALTPVIAGREVGLRAYIWSLPAGSGSPLARLPQTHFARWVLIPELVYEGPPQRPDPLKSQYLLFTSCFDGTEPGPYLDAVRDQMGEEADRIWGNCAGYRGRDDLKRYLLHNQIDTALFFSSYGDTPVADVCAALELRERVQDFVVGHQTTEELALLNEWRQKFGRNQG